MRSPSAQRVLDGVLAMVNPGTLRSLHWGHPRSSWRARSASARSFAATRSRSLLAGLLLGLAIATKQRAVIAIIPTLLAATEQRLRRPALAGAIAIAWPAMLLKPEAIIATRTAVANAQRVVAPANAGRA